MRDPSHKVEFGVCTECGAGRPRDDRLEEECPGIKPEHSMLAACPQGVTNQDKYAAYEWLRSQFDASPHAGVLMAECDRLTKIVGKIPRKHDA